MTESFPVTIPLPTAPVVTPCRVTLAGSCDQAATAIPTVVASLIHEGPLKSGPAARMAAVMAGGASGTDHTLDRRC